MCEASFVSGEAKIFRRDMFHEIRDTALIHTVVILYKKFAYPYPKGNIHVTKTLQTFQENV